MPGFPNTHPHGPSRPERERSNEDLCVRRRGAEEAGEEKGDGQEELEQERRKMEEDMEKKGLSRLRAFVCLAAVSRLSGLAVLPVCCRDPLPPPGLPTALLHAQTQTQGRHLEAKHTCRVVSRDVIWSKKTLFLLYMSIWAN